MNRAKMSEVDFLFFFKRERKTEDVKVRPKK